MTDTLKKIAVVGLGAVGGVFAGLLGTLPPSQKIQLSAIARGQALTALQNQGLVWTDASGQTHQTAVTASNNPADLGPQDVVIVAVKGPSLAGVGTRAETRVDGYDARAYIETSILNPGAYIVEGFNDVMPKNFGKDLISADFDAVVAYLLSLK